MSNDELSRRNALTGGVGFLAGVGAALAVSTMSRDAEAQGTGDVAVLNNLLRAEYLAQQAYDGATGFFSRVPMEDPDRGLAAAAGLVGDHFRSQHADHATRLRTLIMSQQGMPVSESMVSFTLPNPFNRTVRNFLRLACNAEKRAAIDYVNALKTLSNPTAAELAAAIGGVETQHFITLYLLLKGVAQPGPAAAMMVNEISPRSVVAITGESNDLNNIPDFPFMPLGMMM